VVLDHSGQKLAYVYFEEEPGRRSAAKLLERDEAPAYQCKWYPLAAQSPNNHTPTVAAKPSATATSARNHLAALSALATCGLFEWATSKNESGAYAGHVAPSHPIAVSGGPSSPLPLGHRAGCTTLAVT
jgi:hypothetical protein